MKEEGESARVDSSSSTNSPLATTAGEAKPASPTVSLNSPEQSVENACALIDRLRDERNDLLSVLRSLVTYLRSKQERWPRTAEHMAYLADCEAAISKAEGR